MNILSRKKSGGNCGGNFDFASSEDPLEDNDKRKKMVALKRMVHPPTGTFNCQ